MLGGRSGGWVRTRLLLSVGCLKYRIELLLRFPLSILHHHLKCLDSVFLLLFLSNSYATEGAEKRTKQENKQKIELETFSGKCLFYYYVFFADIPHQLYTAKQNIHTGSGSLPLAKQTQQIERHGFFLPQSI